MSESVADWRRLCGLLDIAWGLIGIVADSEQRQALYTMVKRFKPGSLPATVDELAAHQQSYADGLGKAWAAASILGGSARAELIFTGFGDEQLGQPNGRASFTGYQVLRDRLTIGPGWISLASSLRACSILGWARSRPGDLQRRVAAGAGAQQQS